MIAEKDFGSATPITWIGTFPVYLATVLAGAHVVTMILTSLVMAATGPLSLSQGILSEFVFSWNSAALQGKLWQFVTYVFVNPPSLWMILQLAMLVLFGTEVEKFLGRHPFLWLYVTLMLAGPLLLCILGLFGMNMPLMGGAMVHFGIFIAFALIYPKAEILLGIQARWIAVALLGIYTLMGLASRDLVDVGLLWWLSAAAFVYLRWEGAALSILPASISQPALKPSRKGSATKKIGKEPDVHESIDPILEKISRQGIGSLTKDEKTRLERARTALIEKEKPDA